MPKNIGVGTVTVPEVGTFVADALPDPFDARDLEYRPRLNPLPDTLDARADGPRYVMRQDGNSCTGHALAAVINAVLGRTTGGSAGGSAGGNGTGGNGTGGNGTGGNGAGGNGAPGPATRHVSPYMLYYLARRYDEFEGEEDEGSSLRGAIKGWFHHGLLAEERWAALDAPAPDLDDDATIEECAQRPCGAYYRVDPFRLDDMQSAITELHGVVASALLHDGWIQPTPMIRDGEVVHVITRPINATALGGHAFALVGYNSVGFLVQNSWGPEWGAGGFATLRYEDWLQTAYDAWVVRPGVPNTPFASGWSLHTTTSGGLAAAPAPDLRRLTRHVINLANDGRLSTTGSFTSSPAQIDKAFEHMGAWHDFWAARPPADGLTPDRRRHVVLYAHGGLNSEATGLSVANDNVDWWLNNRVYPLFFAWQSGPAETLLNHLTDVAKGSHPPAGIGFDRAEMFDRLLEKTARTLFRWMWDEMKENAEAASDPLDPAETEPRQPGTTLVVRRLRQYVDRHGQGNVAIHLVGHSAGAIFQAALLRRLAAEGLRVTSLALLASAIRVDTFMEQVFPRLADGTVGRFTAFALSDQRELDDVCGARGVNVYQKSLLYLVSRALERAVNGLRGEVPLLGMERFFDRTLSDLKAPAPPGTLAASLAGTATLRRAIEATGGRLIFSRSVAPADQRSDAISHGGFAADPQTMTSVVMRALGLGQPRPENEYRSNAPLIFPKGDVPIIGRPPAPAATPAMTAPGEPPPAQGAAAPGSLPITAEAHERGATPVTDTAPPQPGQPDAPAPSGPWLSPEVAVAPRSGSPGIDTLEASGWTVLDGDHHDA